MYTILRSSIFLLQRISNFNTTRLGGLFLWLLLNFRVAIFTNNLFWILILTLASRKCLVFKKCMLEAPIRPLYFDKILDGKALTTNFKVMCLILFLNIIFLLKYIFFGTGVQYKRLHYRDVFRTLPNGFQLLTQFQKRASTHIFNL